LFIAILIFYTETGSAQEVIPAFIRPDSANHRIDLKFEGYYNSLALTNEFTSLFIHGGHLDTTLKNQISENLGNQNRIGAEISYGLSYRHYHSHLFGQPEWGWYAAAEQVMNYHASFTKNAFDLLFYGNTRFSGDTIQLAAVEGEGLSWHKFTFGGFHKSNNSSLGISFLKGLNYRSLAVGNAQLYTAPLGEELDLSLNASYRQSDTSQTDLDAFNGWGLSTDIVFYLNIGKNRNVKFKNAFRISIQNLGFISWNDRSLVTELDTQYHFNGFEVDDLFDSSSYNFSERAKDTFHIVPVQRSFVTVLPFSLSFSKIADPNSTEKIQGIYGVRMRMYSFYRPLFYAGLYFKPSAKVNMSLYGIAGGYGGLKLGYSVHAVMLKNLHLSAACSNLLGFSRSGFGQDLTLQVSYAF